MEKNTKTPIAGNRGAAILDFGTQDNGRANVEKCMSNDGPNLMANEKPNRVTPYDKLADTNPQAQDKVDAITEDGASIKTGFKLGAHA